MNKLPDEYRYEFYSLTTDRHIKSRPPHQAYLFFLKDKDIIEYDPQKPFKTVRKIFDGGVEFNSFEEEKIQKLYDEIDKINNSANLINHKMIRLPPFWKMQDSLRFLQSNNFNIHNTIDELKRHFHWRKENIKDISFKGMHLLNSGFLYIHGRDSRFRPIIVLILKSYKDYIYIDWKIAIIYLLEYIINNLFIPGQIESWNILCDIKGVRLMLPNKEIKNIFTLFYENHKCRLNKMWIVNAGVLSSKLISRKIFVDKNDLNKVEFANGRELFSTVHPSQIESKFGGSASDLKEYYFPPVFPSDTYFINNSDTERLLTEEEYVNIVKSNRGVVQSPYLNYSNYISSIKDRSLEDFKSIKAEIFQEEIEDPFDIFIEDKYYLSHRYMDCRVRDIDYKNRSLDLSEDDKIIKNHVYDSNRSVNKALLFVKNYSNTSTKYENAKEFNVELTKTEKKDCCNYNSKCLIM